MMEKNKILLLIIMMLAFILGIGNVKAEGACSTTDLNNLRQEAANVKATYVPNEVTDDDGAGREVLDLKVYNVTPKMILQYTYSGKGIQAGSFVRTASDAGTDGAITVRQSSYGMVINYVIKVLANYGSCTGQTLKTIRVSLPVFNYYSLLDVCDGIQDYYLCQPYVMTVYTGADFYDKVETYKAKMLENNAVETDDDNNSVMTAAFSGVKKHKYLIVGVVVAIGVIATVVILKRKKSEA